MTTTPSYSPQEVDHLAEMRRNRIAAISSTTVAHGVAVAHRGNGVVAFRTQTSIGGVVQHSTAEAIDRDYAAALAEETDRTLSRWDRDAHAFVRALPESERRSHALGYLLGTIEDPNVTVAEIRAVADGIRHALMNRD